MLRRIDAESQVVGLFFTEHEIPGAGKLPGCVAQIQRQQLPLLMVLLGGLLLLARSPAIPEQREPGRPKDGEPPR